MGEAAGGWGRVEGLPHPASMRRRTVARGRPDAFTKPSIVRSRRSDLWAGGRVANMRLAWGGCDRTRQNAKERERTRQKLAPANGAVCATIKPWNFRCPEQATQPNWYRRRGAQCLTRSLPRRLRSGWPRRGLCLAQAIASIHLRRVNGDERRTLQLSSCFDHGCVGGRARALALSRRRDSPINSSVGVHPRGA